MKRLREKNCVRGEVDSGEIVKSWRGKMRGGDWGLIGE